MKITKEVKKFIKINRWIFSIKVWRLLWAGYRFQKNRKNNLKKYII